MRIYFFATAGRKIAFGGKKYIKKAAVLQCLSTLMEVAEFNNFGKRKPSDDGMILWYLNFNAKVKIDKKNENVRITVALKKDGKAYYNHEVNLIKTRVLSSRTRK